MLGLSRRQLIGAVKLLFLLGLLLLFIPFIYSTGVLDTEHEPLNGIVVDTTLLPAGQFRAVQDNAGREVWVYRWSEQQRTLYKVNNPQQAWSVFIPYEPFRACRVQISDGETDRAAFFEPCLGARFDVYGRRRQNSGDPRQRDLPRVPFRWLDETRLLVMPSAPGVLPQ